MTEQGWQDDPAGRFRLRWHDGTAWTDQVSDDSGAALTDPAGVPDAAAATEQIASAWPTEPIASAQPDESPPGETPKPAETWAHVGVSPDPPADPPGPPKPVIWRRGWFLAGAVVLALFVGVGIGGVATQGDLDKEESKVAAAQKRVSNLQSDLSDARDQIDDRKARQEADEARTERIAAEDAEQQREAEQAAADEAERAAEEAAALGAEQAARAAEEAAALAARDAEKNTASGSAVYSIGTDINPGRWHTDGGGQCYYAVLNSTDTFDIAINNNIDGPATIDLPAGKFFETAGPCVWNRQG